MFSPKDIKEYIQETRESLKYLEDNIDENYIKAYNLLKEVKGNIIFTGLGKSGHIAQKASASYTSTGNPSLFLNPVDALHGDLGVIKKDDLVILISKSGNTQEVVELARHIHKMNIKAIAITNTKDCLLNKYADVGINMYVKKELCIHNLAPTTSTTHTLIILDIFMVLLMRKKEFKKENFALYHPKGTLGKQLLLTAGELITDPVYYAKKTADFTEILEIASKKSKGIIPIVENDKIIGIISDGDIRRIIRKYKKDVFDVKIEQVMTSLNIKTVVKSELAICALKIMTENHITALPVLDEEGKLAGIINIHDILNAGLRIDM